MRQRIITGLVGIPVILLCLFTVRPLMVLLVAALMAAALYELARMYAPKRLMAFIWLPALGAAGFLLTYLLGWSDWQGVVLALYLVALVALGVFAYPRLPIQDIAFLLLMLVYGAWTFMHALTLYDVSRGSWLLLMAFLTVWFSDSGAYFVGRAFGQRKMAPQLSPNKTIEGALGGLAFAVLALLIANAFIKALPSPLATICFALAIAVVGILGDLFESLLKRTFDVKDSGNILPGHGGILDRFDSFMLVLPVVSYLLPFLATL
ncbi:phosphatidate cytidylyltransferase [Peptococcus simiae]|uniref:phosphatidate cytidylyltransferase n=1 Tax=Peptococcus simiae TaxID=1643805 RepID=UPI00397F4D22